MRISRRTFLAGTAAGLTCTGGFVALSTSSDLDLMRATLSRILGNLRIHDVEFGRFVEAFKASGRNRDDFRGRLFIRVVEFSGLAEPMREHGPPKFSEYTERYERKLLTSFVLWTDYLEAEPQGRETVFLGEAGCQNPFADFRFE